MQVQSIIYPMAALFLLNMIVMFLMLFFRVNAVRTRKVSPRYFKLNQGSELPDILVKLSQNYNNLLELPILFYIICITSLFINAGIENFALYAWIYVVLRYIHSAVHITYNHILHRLAFFTASSFVLIFMWFKVIFIVS